MKRIYLMAALVTILMATAGLTSKPAQAYPLRQGACTQATLAGAYQFLAPTTVVIGPGTVIAIPEVYLNSSPAVYASQGTVHFAGNGQVTLEATADLHGQLAAPLATNGEYTVNRNCTAQVILANGTRFAVRVMQSAEPLWVVSTTPGFVLITTTENQVVEL